MIDPVKEKASNNSCLSSDREYRAQDNHSKRFNELIILLFLGRLPASNSDLVPKPDVPGSTRV